MLRTAKAAVSCSTPTLNHPRVVGSLHLSDLAVDVQKVKRNTVFDEGRVRGRIVAAADGIAVLSGYRRAAAMPAWRVASGIRKSGVRVEQVLYYHRAVACQIVSSPVKAEREVDGGGFNKL